LLGNPGRLQASGDAAAPGGNAKVLGMAQLATKGLAAFGGQTLGARHSQIVSKLAQNVSSAQADLEDQQKMTAFVRSQRDAVSAVSLDEEMASLVMFQKAFQASAKLISMTDEMLATIIGM
jgi:flagellar hook-associated protein 1 FlgK